jgi:hypothetical protein
MSVLGILTCEILELEFAHLVRSDQDVQRITVLEDERSARFLMRSCRIPVILVKS